MGGSAGHERRTQKRKSGPVNHHDVDTDEGGMHLTRAIIMMKKTQLGQSAVRRLLVGLVVVLTTGSSLFFLAVSSGGFGRPVFVVPFRVLRLVTGRDAESSLVVSLSARRRRCARRRCTRRVPAMYQGLGQVGVQWRVCCVLTMIAHRRLLPMC
jgi:hypothetical protein